MINFLFPILVYLSWVGINTIFSGLIKKAISHPKYSIPIIDGKGDLYATKVLFIGLFLLPFYKRIRWKRIKEYYDYVNRNRNDILMGKIHGVMYGIPITVEEIDNLGRWIKLEEIKRKTKKR